MMGALERTLERIARFNDGACLVGRYGSLTLLGLMTIAILIQVFFRYVLGSALTWSEEAARYMMVWMTFLVAPIAYRMGANVALEVLAARIHGRVAEALKIALNLLVILFIVTFFVETFGLIGRGFKISCRPLLWQSRSAIEIFMNHPRSRARHTWRARRMHCQRGRQREVERQ